MGQIQNNIYHMWDIKKLYKAIIKFKGQQKQRTSEQTVLQ